MESLLQPVTYNAGAIREKGYRVKSMSSFRLGTEDTLHALVTCTELQGVWMEDQVGVLPRDQADFCRWWNALYTTKPFDTMEGAAISCWAMWSGRNDLIWNKKSSPVALIYRRAVESLT